MSDGGIQGRAHDPDATVVMPSARQQADETHIIPVVAPDAGPGALWDPGAVTAEQVVVEPGPTERAGSADETSAAVAKHGSVMAMASIVSRVTGYLRTAAIGAAIGAGLVADDYNLANVLPGMVYELLLGGVLASVVVPLIVRARTNDVDKGEAYAQRLLSLAAIFLAGATVIAVLCAPLFTSLLTSDLTAPNDRQLITTLSYMLLPMIFFYGMAALFAAVLNTRGHFAAPALTPILNNIVVIAMAALFFLLSRSEQPTAESLTVTQISILGLGTTLGIVIQAIGLWPALRRVGFRWKWRWDFRQLHLRELARISTWMLVYVLVSQVAVVVILNLAKRAGDTAAAAGEAVAGPAIFNNAFLIFMMAHGIIAVSIITVLMPRMSAAVAEKRYEDLLHQISLGTRLAAVILLPLTVLYVVLGRPLAVTLFDWGNYGHQAALDTGWVIAMAGLGLVPFAISQIQLFAFYAMPDTKTPAVINIPVVALRIGVDVALYALLAAAWVAVGLMAGNAISYVLAVVLGYALLRRRIGPLGLRAVFGTLGRLAAAALIAAAPTVVVVLLLHELWGDGKVASFGQLAIGSVVLGVAYLAAAYLLRIREVRELGSMLRGRLGR